MSEIIGSDWNEELGGRELGRMGICNVADERGESCGL